MNVKLRHGSKAPRVLYEGHAGERVQTIAPGTPAIEVLRHYLAQPLPPLSHRDERYTTRLTIEWVLARMGIPKFDLDVAACRESHHAADYYGLDHPRGPRDGLSLDWWGNSYGNVPFSQWAHWIAWAWWQFLFSPRFVSHAMILPNDRTEQWPWHDMIEPFRDAFGPYLTTHYLRARTKYSAPGMKGRVISNGTKKGGSPFFSSVCLVWNRTPRKHVLDLAERSFAAHGPRADPRRLSRLRRSPAARGGACPEFHMSRRLEVMPLIALKPHPRNPKEHDERLIGASFKRFGFTEALLLDERTGFVLAGNGRLEKLTKMRDAGEVPPVGVEQLDGDWGVLVNRGWASKDDEQADAYLIASNEISIKGGWHEGKLDELLLRISGGGQNVEQLLATGYGKSDVSRILAKLSPPDDDAEGGHLTPSEAAPWVKDGAHYQLGAHRVLVGDSLIAENRRRLIGSKPVDVVMADPPYAIYGSSSGISSSIADDKMVLPFFESYWRGVAEHLKEFGHSYTWCDWRSWTSLVNTLRRVTGLEVKNGLTWDKGGSGLGTNYAMASEWVLFVHRLEPKRAMRSVTERTGVRPVNKPNVFRENRPHGEERLHNAAKPVKVLREWVKGSTDAGERVWDPFSGSGSVLMACEREGRACLAGEMDVRNAQITIERWQRATGQKAVEVEQ